MKFERFNMEDTISAVATAWGEGGIGIVRISGPEAKDVLERIFMPIKKIEKKAKVSCRTVWEKPSEVLLKTAE